MPNDNRIKNGRERTIIDIRKGGPGNAWEVLDVDAELAAISGFEQGVESQWGRTEDGQGSRYLGHTRTGNPERGTGQTMIPLTPSNFLRLKKFCPFDARWRHRCGDLRDINSYTETINFYDGVPTSRGYDNNLANATEGDDVVIKRQYDMSYGLEDYEVKLAHLDISGTKVDVAINKVRHLGAPRCAGDCGSEQTGEEYFGFVTDRDSSPGYAGNPAPYFGYTKDGGQTVTLSTINVFTAADALDFVRVGNRIVVVSSQKGVAYATLDDIENEVAAPWALSTGISANFPQVLAITNKNTIWAAGTGGNIYKSTDGGFSFTTWSAGTITTQTINSIAFVSDDFGWFAANAGVLIRYSSGSGSIVTVKTAVSGGSTLSANINVVRTAENRGNEVYLGTAGGEIWRSRLVDVQIPLFVNMAFDKKGIGSIDDLQFVGYNGTELFVLQSDVSGNSRVLRDRSGGALGDQVEIIGSFTSPSNFNINSIAMANINFGLSVGEIHETYAFIGSLQKA